MKSKLTPASVQGKTVLLRLDLDVPLEGREVGDNTRLKLALPSLNFCLKHAKKTLILGYLGRPQERTSQFSLHPVQKELKRLLHQDILLISELKGVGKWGKESSPLALLENLRFWPGENSNDQQFASQLASFGQVLINDSFATSHRQIASTVGIAKIIPSYIGMQFQAELTALQQFTGHSSGSTIIVIGGAKPNKLTLIHNLIQNVDKILLGGALPRHFQPQSEPEKEKIISAQLTPDNLDITSDSAQNFASLLQGVSTIVLNGPMGKFESKNHLSGTKIVFEAIARSPAFTMAGGGDTMAALSKFNLIDKINHLSTGGGAMLYYLAHRTLPALEASS